MEETVGGNYTNDLIWYWSWIVCYLYHIVHPIGLALFKSNETKKNYISVYSVYYVQTQYIFPSNFVYFHPTL